MPEALAAQGVLDGSGFGGIPAGYRSKHGRPADGRSRTGRRLERAVGTAMRLVIWCQALNSWQVKEFGKAWHR
jgi:hypothetical protein